MKKKVIIGTNFFHPIYLWSYILQDELDINSLAQDYAERQTDYLADGPHKVNCQHKLWVEQRRIKWSSENLVLRSKQKYKWTLCILIVWPCWTKSTTVDFILHTYLKSITPIWTNYFHIVRQIKSKFKIKVVYIWNKLIYCPLFNVKILIFNGVFYL